MKSKTLLACSAFTLVSPFLAVSKTYAQTVGFEREFATVGYMESQWGDKQLATSRAMLEIVQRNFGGSGQIESVLWEKYPDLNIQHLIYRDPNGGTWSVDPESVNTAGLDGLELVTPPLEGEDDLKKAQDILRDIKRQKLVMRGLRSSGHVTVDVSSLLKDKNNVSEIVDLILTIENRWPEIYSFFNPKRYGTIINRFSVPLAIDQQNLLKELAALPKEARTYDNVRGIFLKYEAVENELRNSDGKNAVRNWKYRAANYAKLFELNNNRQSSIIELRIPDLEFGDKLVDQAHFMRRLVNLDNKDTTFKAPFGLKPLGWKEASALIETLPRDSIFATKMGISVSSITSSNQRPVDLIDITRPNGKEGYYLTYGFEAEFRGSNQRNVLTDAEEVRSDIFPFLDPSVSKEGTGNLEIKSYGGEVHLDEVLEQMTKVRSALKTDLRGFHFRVRIPKQLVNEMGEEALKAYANAVGDYVFAWRLQNRRTFFSLNSRTVGRNDVTSVSNRGSIRLVDLDGGGYDFEIRGLMTDISMVGKVAQIFATGILNPKAIQTSYQERHARTSKSKSLTDFIRLYRPLTEADVEILRKLAADITREGILPLYRFEDSVGLSEHEKVRIRNANFEFAKEVMTVVRNVQNNKYNGDKNEAGKQFRWRIKRWAQSLDLQSLLEKNLLISDSEKLNTKVTTPLRNPGLRKIERDFQDLNPNVRAEAIDQLALKSGEKSLVILERALSDQSPIVRSQAARVLTYKSGEKAFSLIRKATQDLDPYVRGTAFSALYNHVSEISVQLIEVGLQDPDVEVRKNAASALGYQVGGKALSLIEKSLQDTNEEVRGLAAQGLFRHQGPKALALIEKCLQDPDDNLKRSGARALERQSGPKALELIKIHIKDPIWFLKVSAVKALKNQSGGQALDLIETLLMDTSTDESIRYEAVKALAKHDGDRSVLLLVKAFQVSRNSVRVAVAEALASRTEPKALEFIRSISQNPDPEVRALSKIIQTEQARAVINSRGSLNIRRQIDLQNQCSMVFFN